MSAGVMPAEGTKEPVTARLTDKVELASSEYSLKASGPNVGTLYGRSNFMSSVKRKTGGCIVFPAGAIEGPPPGGPMKKTAVFPMVFVCSCRQSF